MTNGDSFRLHVSKLIVSCLTQKGRISVKTLTGFLLFSILGCGMLVLVPGPSGAAIKPNELLPEKQEFTGTVVGTGGGLGGVSRSFTLTIERFNTNADARRAAEILRTQGQDGLQKAIGKNRLGYFALAGQVGLDLNFVRERRVNGRRRITVVFERWLNMYEVRYGTRSEDYPFSYIELFIDENGKGEGTLIPAAKISFNRKQANQVDIENFGIYPARLVGVEWHNKPEVPR